MKDADLVKRIRQPKMLLNIIAGSAAVIGCFGMFNSNAIIKNFSVVLTITAGIELALGERVAKLYSDAALDAFSSDLEKRKNDIASVEKRLNELEIENESWKLRDSELELALQTLEAERDAARGEFQHEKQSKLLMEVALGESAAIAKNALARLEACNKEIAMQHEKLLWNGKQTLTQAISQWVDNLESALDSSERVRGESKAIVKIRSELVALKDFYKGHITDLKPSLDIAETTNEMLWLLQQAGSEVSSIKVRFRKTLGIEAMKPLQEQVSALNTAVPLEEHQRVLGNFKSLLSEFKVEKDETIKDIIEHIESVETELTQDTDEYVKSLIAQLEQATAKICELQAAHKFPGTTEQSRVGNSIIDYYSRLGFILDALDWDDSECGYRLMFYVGRNPRFISAEMLNDGDLPEKLKELTGAIALPKFAYNTRGGHVVLEVQTRKAKKKDTSEADISRLWVSASQFEKTVKGWSRVRLTGGSESGKSPTAENLAVAILNHRLGIPYLFNPQHDSVKNHWSIPTVGTNHKDSEKGIKALAEQVDLRANGQQSRDEFELSIFDEIDSTMSHTKGKKAVIGGNVKFIIKQASHQNLGAIFIGQNANASEYPGMDRSDWNSAVNVHIGANAYDAIENSNRFTSDEQAKLKKTADKLTEFCTTKNEELSLDKTDPNAYRFALVIEPEKKPYFIELPAFGTYTYTPCCKERQVETGASVGVSPLSTDVYTERVSGCLDVSRHSGIEGVETRRDISDKPACPYCKSDKVRSKGDSWLCQNPDHYLLASGTPKSWKKQ